MALMCYSPLGGAAVAGNIRRNVPRVADTRLARMPELMASPEDVVLRINDAIEQVAAETGKTFAQIALNWVRSRPGVCSAIFAARTEAQLVDNLGAVGWKRTPQHIELLDRASGQQPACPYSHQHQFPTIHPPPVPYYNVTKS